MKSFHLLPFSLLGYWITITITITIFFYLPSVQCSKVYILAGFTKTATIQIQSFLRHVYHQLPEKNFCQLIDVQNLMNKTAFDEIPLDILNKRQISPETIITIEDCVTNNRDIILASDYFLLLNKDQLKTLKTIFPVICTFNIIFYYREWLSRLTNFYFDELFNLETNLIPFSKYVSYHAEEMSPTNLLKPNQITLNHRKLNYILVIQTYQVIFEDIRIQMHSYDTVLLQGKLLIGHFYCELLGIFCGKFHTLSSIKKQNDTIALAESINTWRNITSILENSFAMPIQPRSSSSASTSHHGHSNHHNIPSHTQYHYHMLLISPLHMIILEFVMRFHTFIHMKGYEICEFSSEKLNKLALYYHQHADGLFVQYHRNSTSDSTASAPSTSYSFLIPVKLFNTFGLRKIAEEYDNGIRKLFSKNLKSYEKQSIDAIRGNVKIVEIDEELFMKNSTWRQFQSSEFDRLLQHQQLCAL